MSEELAMGELDALNQQSQPRSRERPTLLELLESVEWELQQHDSEYHHVTRAETLANLRNAILVQRGLLR